MRKGTIERKGMDKGEGRRGKKGTGAEKSEV